MTTRSHPSNALFHPSNALFWLALIALLTLSGVAAGDGVAAYSSDRGWEVASERAQRAIVS